jgi:hypothetical protein
MNVSVTVGKLGALRKVGVAVLDAFASSPRHFLKDWVRDSDTVLETSFFGLKIRGRVELSAANLSVGTIIFYAATSVPGAADSLKRLCYYSFDELTNTRTNDGQLPETPADAAKHVENDILKGIFANVEVLTP